MSTDATRIEGYAAALFEAAAAEGQVAEVEDQLYRVARAIETSEELRSTLSDQRVPASKRQSIVEDLVGARALPVTTNLVSFLVGAGRARDLPAIIDRFVQRASRERGAAVAEVRSAIPLDDAVRDRLAEALGRATGRQVDVKVVVDPSVIGGLVAQIGDTVIDGSVRKRLDQMKERL